MIINGREISCKLPPYIIGEISGNHCGKKQWALDLIKAAKDAGADAAKLQCYTPETITLDCDKPDFIIKDGPWNGRKLYELYQSAYTPWNWFPDLFEYAKSIGITLFSSVFDNSSVDFLENLGCPAYKIASMEITDTNLITYAAKTGKPLIISTGMASWEEIQNAKEAAGNNKPLFLHCISGYSTPVKETNLIVLKHGWAAGISDHTVGWTVPVAATALGAVMIEKHLKLDINKYPQKPEDSRFSMSPDSFRGMTEKVRPVWKAMQPSARKSEESSRQARRSLYVVKDMKAGEKFTEENVRSIRPAYGLPPSRLSSVLCCHAHYDIEAGTALKEEHLE